MSICVGISSDDSASAASSMEVTDRLASLEQRVQMQEDEIQLLKSALADVVRRLNASEEQQAMHTRKGPTKGKTVYPTCLCSQSPHHPVAKGERGHPTRTRTRVYRVPNMRSDRHTKEPGSMAAREHIQP